MRRILLHLVLYVALLFAVSCDLFHSVSEDNKEAVHTGIAPHSEEMLSLLENFSDELYVHGLDYSLDGVTVFGGQDRFLQGKIALGLSYLLTELEPESSVWQRHMQQYPDILSMMQGEPNATWGIYYYLSALNRLREAGLLTQALSEELLADLETELDWRGFVDESDYSLISLPANYYGVAFSIARLRYMLGWDEPEHAQQLLDRTVQHYHDHSGEFGFSDERPGEGVFDRYSILLIGEIAQRFRETGMEPDTQILSWLRGSADFVLHNLNTRGDGFLFGRSIGAYGDTAFAEILSAAAYYDLLSSRELNAAYMFSRLTARKFLEFWYDQNMQSVNLWEHGRRTDAYRGKHRILGENLSLIHHHLYTGAIWDDLGFTEADFLPEQYANWLDGLPQTTVTWFTDHDYDRAAITWRDDGRLFSLWISNGGSYHQNTPYYPIPFSLGLIQASPNEDYPQLVPRITLNDGSELMPLVYSRNLDVQVDGEMMIVRYSQDELNSLGGSRPSPDSRITVEIEYTFKPGEITRQDTFIAMQDVEIDSVTSVYAGFCPPDDILNTIDFSGFDSVSVISIHGNEDYFTPEGPLSSLATAVSSDITLNEGEGIQLQWHIKY